MNFLLHFTNSQSLCCVKAIIHIKLLSEVTAYIYTIYKSSMIVFGSKLVRTIF